MAMGASLPGPALSLFVKDLEPLPDEEIQLGLTRCRREIGGNGYAPTLTIKDVLDRAGVVAQDKVDNAECRAAWDALLLHGSKHIVADPEGCYGPRHYFGMKTEMPGLEQRTTDALRRIGGWKVIKTMTEDDYPHVQRRFYEEYCAWEATETALMRGALAGNEAFTNLLQAKSMPEPKRLAELRRQVRQLGGAPDKQERPSTAQDRRLQ